jgi:DNA-binding NtrC family response regulator
MKTKVFIVEDQFAEAHNLQLILQRAGYQVCGIARSMQSALTGIEKEKPQLVLLDIFLKGEGTGIDLARKLREQHIAFVFISANFDTHILTTAKETQPYGFLIKPFRESDVLVTLEIALFRHQFSIETKYHKLEVIQEQLNNLLLHEDKKKDLVPEFGKILQSHIPFDFLTISTIVPGFGMKINGCYLRVGYHEYQQIDIKEWVAITGLKETVIHDVLKTMPVVSEPTYYTGDSFEKEENASGMIKMIGKVFHMQSFCCIPAAVHNGMPVQVSFFSRRADCYDSRHLDLLGYLKSTLQVYFQKSLLAPFPNTNVEPAAGNKAFVSPGAQSNIFPGIVGKSHGLLSVFDSIMQVAPFDTSVLLLGESGTGKEQVASCIQELSARKEKPFVKVNCAALPASLIESELFGHEKGAFTGAHETHKGCFEEAMNGTIFLDEIGEIPPEVQVKLLRILQEKEIRRVGGRSPLKVNVRIIAATNRNLEELVAEGRFRLDLYYRLNVFPIQLPPLRDRKEDIPLLALHFIKKYSTITGKKIEGLSEKVMDELMAYNWPGNIREMENVMERSLLRASGSLIEQVHLTIGTIKPAHSNPIGEGPLKTIEENERDYILAVLKQCNGRIWGKGGAASLLNMPPTTLNSRIKKLGIKREFIG